MTKAEIVNKIASNTGIEKSQVQAVVQAFMKSVKESLAQGEPVYLRGFGSFIVKRRAQKDSSQYYREHHYGNSCAQRACLQAF